MRAKGHRRTDSASITLTSYVAGSGYRDSMKRREFLIGLGAASVACAGFAPGRLMAGPQAGRLMVVAGQVENFRPREIPGLHLTSFG